MLAFSRTLANVAPLRQAAEERRSARGPHMGARVVAPPTQRLVRVTMDSAHDGPERYTQTMSGRRDLLVSTCALPLSLTLSQMLAAPVAEAEEPMVPKAETLTSPSGVKYQIIKPGSGPAAQVRRVTIRTFCCPSSRRICMNCLFV